VTSARLEALLRVLLVGAMVLLLEAACRLGWVAPTAVIPPSAMVRSLVVILVEGTATADLVATLSRVATAAVLSAVMGLGVGLMLHAQPRLRAAVEPVLSAWYAIPTIMFYPVLLVVFGAGAGAIVATAVLLAAVAMVSSTLAGLDRVPPALLRTARVLRMGRIATAWQVRLPSAAPYVFAGLKLVVAYGFIGVIASEFILSGSGLGYAIANAYNNFDNGTMYGLMLLIVLLVTGVNAALSALDRRMRR
jgi:NitT/TauT family transport system permease protein